MGKGMLLHEKGYPFFHKGYEKGRLFCEKGIGRVGEGYALFKKGLRKSNGRV